MQYGNAIIFSLVTKNGHIVPTGSLYDSIEYFLQIYEENKDINLLLNVLPFNASINLFQIKDQLTEIILERYNLDSDLTFMYNIETIDLRTAFIDHTFEKVLTIDLVSPKFFKQFMIRSKEIFIIPEYTDEEHFYQSKFNKVTYFTEMPFCYCDVPYVMKFAFNKMREFESFSPYLYINYPKGDWKTCPATVEWVADYEMPPLTKDDHFYLDLHRHFQHYLYIKTPYWFDPHPRLFHECAFYGKPFNYINSTSVRDGSYYRANDARYGKLSDRELTKDDKIVRRMIT